MLTSRADHPSAASATGARHAGDLAAAPDPYLGEFITVQRPGVASEPL